MEGLIYYCFLILIICRVFRPLSALFGWREVRHSFFSTNRRILLVVVPSAVNTTVIDTPVILIFDTKTSYNIFHN